MGSLQMVNRPSAARVAKRTPPKLSRRRRRLSRRRHHSPRVFDP